MPKSLILRTRDSLSGENTFELLRLAGLLDANSAVESNFDVDYLYLMLNRMLQLQSAPEPNPDESEYAEKKAKYDRDQAYAAEIYSLIIEHIQNKPAVSGYVSRVLDKPIVEPFSLSRIEIVKLMINRMASKPTTDKERKERVEVRMRITEMLQNEQDVLDYLRKVIFAHTESRVVLYKNHDIDEILSEIEGLQPGEHLDVFYLGGGHSVTLSDLSLDQVKEITAALREKGITIGVVVFGSCLSARHTHYFHDLLVNGGVMLSDSVETYQNHFDQTISYLSGYSHELLPPDALDSPENRSDIAMRDMAELLGIAIIPPERFTEFAIEVAALPLTLTNIQVAALKEKYPFLAESLLHKQQSELAPQIRNKVYLTERLAGHLEYFTTKFAEESNCFENLNDALAAENRELLNVLLHDSSSRGLFKDPQSKMFAKIMYDFIVNYDITDASAITPAAVLAYLQDSQHAYAENEAGLAPFMQKEGFELEQGIILQLGALSKRMQGMEVTGHVVTLKREACVQHTALQLHKHYTGQPIQSGVDYEYLSTTATEILKSHPTTLGSPHQISSDLRTINMLSMSRLCSDLAARIVPPVVPVQQRSVMAAARSESAQASARVVSASSSSSAQVSEVPRSIPAAAAISSAAPVGSSTPSSAPQVAQVSSQAMRVEVSQPAYSAASLLVASSPFLSPVSPAVSQVSQHQAEQVASATVTSSGSQAQAAADADADAASTVEPVRITTTIS